MLRGRLPPSVICVELGILGAQLFGLRDGFGPDSRRKSFPPAGCFREGFKRICMHETIASVHSHGEALWASALHERWLLRLPPT
jgi:hypothetical protein